MISGYAWVLIILAVEDKTQKEPEPGKLIRPGIEPGPARLEAAMLPLAHSAQWVKTQI